MSVGAERQEQRSPTAWRVGHRAVPCWDILEADGIAPGVAVLELPGMVPAAGGVVGVVCVVGAGLVAGGGFEGGVVCANASGVAKSIAAAAKARIRLMAGLQTGSARRDQQRRERRVSPTVPYDSDRF